ncbi:hypothetical protein QAD02_017908 [Eretmocerus hayati]|uniref:Uncharacterized protein n=1 Tax=Eretmocerus hayati TaxID=131215 RepID=A0ACC2PF62_9HYME|nr:hypothetical protein QAD02_017908 [Eretmocerus hayati]
MKCKFKFLIVLFGIHVSVAPPVTKDEIQSNEIPDSELKLEYERYMTQVVTLLETDPKFKAKLENATKEEITDGTIAEALEHVDHKIRTQLDELKRLELDRLGKLILKIKHEQDGLDFDHLKIKEHVDHENPHTFEIKDLKNLIHKVTKDLEEIDKKRREKFKEYEMEKQFEQEEKKKQMNDEEKKKYEHELDEQKKKHKEHEQLHSPGSKKQLEEVWEKQDHMDQEFDPRTFFYLHDLNGDGYWDQNEVKALFLKELDKLYAEGHPEDDLMERAEELERMREHVMREADIDRDGLISYQEFLDQSKKTEFEKDPGWETLDQQQIYSEQEYENYRRQKEMELQQAISRGMPPDHHPGGQLPAGHQQPPQQQVPQQPNQLNTNQIPQQSNQLNTNQIPQQPNQLNTNQIPQQVNQQAQNTNTINQAQQPNLANGAAAAQSNNHVVGQAQGQIASLNNAAQSH